MKNHGDYAKYNGYDYRVLTAPVEGLANTTHADVRWHKSFLVKSLLATYEWVFWTDCDALFMNFSMSLPVPATNLPTRPHFILCGDINNAINTGQFLIDNSVWSMDFLSKVHETPVMSMKEVSDCGGGTDNAVFNLVLWNNCKVSKARVKTMDACNGKIKQAVDPWALACAPLNTYKADYFRMSPLERTKVLRMHFAGPQTTKLKDIQRYSKMVVTGEAANR